MGRLIRKKTSSSKKKAKSLGQETSSSPAKSDGATRESAAKTAVSSGDSVVKKIIPIVRRSSAVSKTAAGKQKKNFIDKSIQFLREVKIELKKVTWPSKKQTMGSTVVVIILVMIISLFLGMVDFGLSSLIRVILQ